MLHLESARGLPELDDVGPDSGDDYDDDYRPDVVRPRDRPADVHGRGVDLPAIVLLPRHVFLSGRVLTRWREGDFVLSSSFFTGVSRTPYNMIVLSSVRVRYARGPVPSALPQGREGIGVTTCRDSSRKHLSTQRTPPSALLADHCPLAACLRILSAQNFVGLCQ